MLQCRTCGQSFSRPPSQAGPYCGRPCSNIGRSRRREAECPECGRTFTQKASVLERPGRHHCSKHCAAKYRSRLPRRQSGPPRTGSHVPCYICGKALWRTKKRLERTNHPVCPGDCAAKERSKRMKGKRPASYHLLHTPEAIAKRATSMRGVNNPAWRGGKIQRRKKPYISLRCPEGFEPMARKDGYVLEHRIVMARQLGRLLDRREVVHHKNGDGRDNRAENLELYRSNGAHLAVTLDKENPESPWHSR